jgi:hypothetical protein
MYYVLDFWTWLFFGDKNVGINRAGYRRVINIWIFFHLLVGVILSGISIDTPSETARLLIIPLSASLVALTFAWSGNVSSILLSDNLVELLKKHDSSFYDITYTFQLASLVILLTICIWGVTALKPFDNLSNVPILIIKTLCFSLTSCAIREGWHVILGVSSLTVLSRNAKSFDQNSPSNQAS